MGPRRFWIGSPLPTSTLLHIPCRLSRVHNRGLKQDGVGGVLLSVPSALCGSPILCRVNQVDLHQPFVRATNATHRPLLSVDFGGLADIAGKGCQGLGFPKDYARFLYITMPSLSQALHLGYLPFPHSAFQDHATHSAGWPACLGPTAQGVPVYPKVCLHSSIMLHGARSGGCKASPARLG